MLIKPAAGSPFSFYSQLILVLPPPCPFRLHRMTAMEREEKEKVKKREKKLEDEETMQQATWVKYTFPIKHQVTSLWGHGCCVFCTFCRNELVHYRGLPVGLGSRKALYVLSFVCFRKSSNLFIHSLIHCDLYNLYSKINQKAPPDF